MSRINLLQKTPVCFNCGTEISSIHELKHVLQAQYEEIQLTTRKSYQIEISIFPAQLTQLNNKSMYSYFVLPLKEDVEMFERNWRIFRSTVKEHFLRSHRIQVDFPSITFEDGYYPTIFPAISVYSKTPRSYGYMHKENSEYQLLYPIPFSMASRGQVSVHFTGVDTKTAKPSLFLNQFIEFKTLWNKEGSLLEYPRLDEMMIHSSSF